MIINPIIAQIIIIFAAFLAPGSSPEVTYLRPPYIITSAAIAGATDEIKHTNLHNISTMSFTDWLSGHLSHATCLKVLVRTRLTIGIEM